jgi:DNA-binding transcriptional MerR regulator
MDDNTLIIQQVAEATGLSEHTRRYYERVGLIHPISRANDVVEERIRVRQQRH